MWPCSKLLSPFFFPCVVAVCPAADAVPRRGTEHQLSSLTGTAHVAAPTSGLEFAVRHLLATRQVCVARPSSNVGTARRPSHLHQSSKRIDESHRFTASPLRVGLALPGPRHDAERYCLVVVTRANVELARKFPEASLEELHTPHTKSDFWRSCVRFTRRTIP